MKELQTPTLSVILPNFNDARFLSQQLNSLLAQSYRPHEIIVIDDASTDDSIEVLESFMAKESRIRLIRNERNQGVEVCNNRLVAEATGDYVYMAAADDAVLPGFFEKTMALVAQYPQAALCSGLGRTMNEKGRDTGLRALPIISRRPCFLTPAEVGRALSKYGRWFAISSTVVKREALMADGGQVAAVGSFADTLSAMVLSLKHGACFIPVEFSLWRQKTGSHGRTTSSEWDVFWRQGQLIVRLMKTEYAALFSREFVDRFERHWLYGVSMSAAAQTQVDSERAAIEVFRRVANPGGVVDHAGLSVIRFIMRMQSVLWRTYAMVRFGPWRWWMLGRLSIVLNHGAIVIRENQQP